MEKKKISLKAWTYIGKLNHAAKWCRWLCSYTLIKKDEKTFIREQKINILAYIFIFIPIHILQAFVCMWDGGLKEFILFKRDLGQDVLPRSCGSFDRALEVWNGKKIDVDDF
jgi:hypothetical protein